MIQGVEYVTLFVTDLERSVRFYHDLLELPVVQRSPHFVLLDAGNLRLGLHRGDGVPERPPVNLHFVVDDVDQAYEALRRKGLPFHKGPKDQPWGVRSATTADPDGFVVEIVSRLPL
ncbi:VOC family protein [Limnochorda pilosa]|uniref:Glyoxalase n=1 Tax=Limnochorda pilosa TaxID=1555112 RepID=A0A0K2SLY8_LIMPI|nr:VOC family protein [Limnochorda pilosa]BAS28136.1 glyoxalase [Limnochorda pilosa]